MQDKSPNAVSRDEGESGPGAPAWRVGPWRGHAAARARHITAPPSDALVAVRAWPGRPRPWQLPRRRRDATRGGVAAGSPAPPLATRRPRPPGPRRGFPAPPPSRWCYTACSPDSAGGRTLSVWHTRASLLFCSNPFVLSVLDGY